MLKPGIKTWILLALSLAASASSANAEFEYGGFNFSSDFSQEQIQLLKEDINYLYGLPLMKDSNGFLKMTGMKSISGPNIHNWLVNRIHYFFSEKADLEELFILSNQSYKYRNPDQIPKLLEEASNRQDQDAVLASNLGGAIYLLGKKNKTLTMVRLGGRTRALLSPRVGVIQIANAYFDQHSQQSENPNALINRLYRLGTLFHESRHSDGNGLTAGFMHVICPKGHAFEGQPACDDYDNGSYGLEARFARVLSRNCSNCKASDIEALRLVALDSFSRLVLPATGTSKVVRIQQELTTHSYILELCKSIKMNDESCDQEKLKATREKYRNLRYEFEYLIRAENSAHGGRPLGAAEPEGLYEELSLEQSKLLMIKSQAK